MAIGFRDLWRPSGTAGRGVYAVVGVVAFAVKRYLDIWVAGYGFRQHWNWRSYWFPVDNVARITELHGPQAIFLGTMVAVSLPFIWLGTTMTVKRLRSAGLPLALVVLFFVPFVNLLFFLTLCIWPEKSATEPSVQEDWRGKTRLSRTIPESALGSAAISLVIPALLGLAMVWLGVRVFTNYGWGIFVALPFTMGFMSAVIYGLRQPRRLSACIGVACLSMCLLGALLLAVAFEGVICLMMAAPIALVLAIFGGALGYLVQRGRSFGNNAPAYLSMVLLVVPGTQWVEHVVAKPAPVFVVRSSIEIEAPPEEVWKQVVAFTEIGPPRELLFRAGIAYPIRAEIFGHGAGAERHCVFSTGAFVEPIEVWDEPHRLKFSVTSNPAPMEEWTPYSHIDPPHLHGFLESEGGQFLLTALPNGGTRLEGTTWYRHGLWPAEYWRWWSDEIIHRIHMRVLRHIKEEVETAKRQKEEQQN
ncbi:MAG TPA: hypothetical protein VFU86_18305 [Terriglobales bacterium]|nr:hypothetical protein [Terriglobales bacterium]